MRLRSHLGIATTALVLVIPVLVGVVSGGFAIGVLGALVGFVVYDFFFIPPYYTLNVGAASNWIALIVYGIVVLVVARVVVRLQAATEEAIRQGNDFRSLAEISQMLIVERGRDELLTEVTRALVETFGFATAAVLMPDGEGLSVLASAGVALTDMEIARILPSSGRVGGLVIDTAERGAPLYVRTLLSVSGVAGLLVVRPGEEHGRNREVIAALGGAIALAVRQSELRVRLVHSEMLEERDRWRRALVSSISHDLRTPLAAMKASISNLRDSSLELCESDRNELLETIETRTDHLTRLVTNILNMSRIEAEALEPHLELYAVSDLVSDALLSISGEECCQRVCMDLPIDLPLVRVDHALLSQALSNLIENALRHSKGTGQVVVRARASESSVTVSVRDFGPGVPSHRRQDIFYMFEKDPTSEGAGLGLALAQSYLALHESEIVLDDAPGGGAIFSFTLPNARLLGEHRE